jgi:hypothetical protein
MTATPAPQTGICPHGRPYPHTGVGYCGDCAAERFGRPIQDAARAAWLAKRVAEAAFAQEVSERAELEAKARASR